MRILILILTRGAGASRACRAEPQKVGPATDDGAVAKRVLVGKGTGRGGGGDGAAQAQLSYALLLRAMDATRYEALLDI